MASTISTASFSFNPNRRRPVRALLRKLIQLALISITHFQVDGIENLPAEGPLLLVGNHFSFLDPVALINTMPWPMEFVGGLRMPNAPAFVRWIPGLWGVLPVRRGSISRETLLASRQILKRRGRLAIFPEAGSWAKVLRPARPGAAFLATSTDATLLPVGLDGLVDVFPSIRRGKRASVRINIGQPFGPFYVSDRGDTNRENLEDIGHEIMRHIADLIPPNRRGYYSDDPAIRTAAMGTEVYPWDDIQEE
jgi:1-acyl-sn-glycerol-3-phosphate acyltransferase